MADVAWSGAGYYLSDDADIVFGGFIAGPFSNEADCESALSSLPTSYQQDDPSCDYFASDPDWGGG